jgi:hypothetical protein
MKKSYIISRIKNTIKAVKEDAFVTDRYIWSMVTKYAEFFINKLDVKSAKRFRKLYRTLPCVELIEVDKVEAGCSGIKSGCIIMRTKDPIPEPYNGPNGYMIRTVSSLDGDIEIYPTEPGTYTSMTKTTTFKYNKNKYYWYLDGYLYFPNIEWEAVKIEGIWKDDIVEGIKDSDENPECIKAQDKISNIPEDLFAEIEQQVLNEILPQLKIPVDQTQDKINVYR